jgi:nitroreductase
MGLYQAMSTLRAVRRLRADPVPDDVLRRVIEAATFAPTGANAQPWRIVAVRDPARKRRLGELYRAEWKRYAENARRAIASLGADERGRQERAVRAGDHLADHFHETPVILVFCFNPERMAITDAEQPRPSVVGGGSVYPSVENLLLACRAEGLGCVLTTLLCRAEPEVRRLLEIPDPWYTAAAIPVGYPLARGHGPLRRRPPEQLAFLDRFGAPLFAAPIR